MVHCSKHIETLVVILVNSLICQIHGFVEQLFHVAHSALEPRIQGC